MKRLLLAGAALAALSLAPTIASAQVRASVPAAGSSSKIIVPWIGIGCAGSIILSAFHANYRDNRELTQPEAWTCGLLYWLSYPTPKQQMRRARGG
jgi:hypothetical protein